MRNTNKREWKRLQGRLSELGYGRAYISFNVERCCTLIVWEYRIPLEITDVELVDNGKIKDAYALLIRGSK